MVCCFSHRRSIEAPGCDLKCWFCCGRRPGQRMGVHQDIIPHPVELEPGEVRFIVPLRARPLWSQQGFPAMADTAPPAELPGMDSATWTLFWERADPIVEKLDHTRRCYWPFLIVWSCLFYLSLHLQDFWDDPLESPQWVFVTGLCLEMYCFYLLFRPPFRIRNVDTDIDTPLRDLREEFIPLFERSGYQLRFRKTYQDFTVCRYMHYLISFHPTSPDEPDGMASTAAIV